MGEARENEKVFTSHGLRNPFDSTVGDACELGALSRLGNALEGRLVTFGGPRDCIILTGPIHLCMK